MPRRAAAVRREVMPDVKYNNRLVTQLINKVLLDGKKSVAERIVYGAFDIVKEKTDGDPLATFKKAMDNVRPTLEVKPKRVGGATYQVPMEVNSRQRDHGRRQRRWCFREASRGPLQDGRGQPRLLSLPFLRGLRGEETNG